MKTHSPKPRIVKTRPGQHKAFRDPHPEINTPAWNLIGLVLCIILIIAAAIGLSFRPVTDSDFWHHLALGRIVWEQHRFPQIDELGSTSAGSWWVSSGWIVSVLLYCIHGQIGVQILVCLAVCISALWLFLKNCRAGRESLSLHTTMIFAMLAAAYPRFLPRPDLASICLMIPLIGLLTWYERQPLENGSRGWVRAALLPLLFLVWANCHLLFGVGLFIAAIFIAWATWQWRKGQRPDGLLLASTWLASAAVTVVNPYGWKVFWFMWANSRLNETATRINELKPLWLVASEPGGGPLILMIAIWAALCAWLLWRQWRIGGLAPWRVIVIIFLVGLALVQRRQIGLAAFGITALVLDGASGSSVPQIFLRRWSILIPVFLFAGLLGAMSADKLPMVPGFESGARRAEVDCDWFPCEAVGFLKQNPPPAKLFHDLYTGSYLAYQLAPQGKVFIDGRLEVYNNGTYDDFFAPMEGRMPVLALFKKYGVQSAFLDWRTAAEQPGHTAAVLSDAPGWRLCWFSDHYALFVNDGPDATDQAHGYVAQHGYRYLNPLRPQGYMNALASPATLASARNEARRAIAENPDSRLAQKAAEVSGL
jgi:hypothetical protein